MPNEHSPRQERRHLLQAAGIISIFTLLSRILGFVRDVVIAHGFGAGMGADAFFVAFKLPNFLRRLFGEGAFSSAFVPVFNDYLVNHGVEGGEPRRVMQAVFTALTLILLAVVLVGEGIMPWLIRLVAPGFTDDPVKFQLTVELTRITFPYILFISLVALAGGVLNSFHRYAVPSFTPVLLNIFMILAVLVLAPFFDQPAMGLAIGVVLAGVAQLLFQWPFLVQIGMPFRFRRDFAHPAIRRILTMMTPSIVGVSVAQVNLVVDIILASWLPAGSISYLYYADRLVEFPNGLVGIALGTAILPALSAKAARQDFAGFKVDLDFALRLVAVINIPATIGLILLREPLLAILFERGAFSPEATRLTAQALMAFSLGLLPFSAVKVIAPAFYALQDTRTPVRIAIFCMLANIVMNLILMIPFQHAGLALSTSIASFMNAGLLLAHISKRLEYRLSRGFYQALLKSSLATGVMGLFLAGCTYAFWEGISSLWGKVGLLTLMIGGGMVIFAATAWLLKLDELQELRGMVRRRKVKEEGAGATPQQI